MGRELTLPAAEEMRLFFNLNDGAITLGLGDRGHISTALPGKSGQDEPLELMFHRDGVAELLPALTTFVFGVKTAETFEGNHLTFIGAHSPTDTSWTRPADETGYYTATLDMDTVAIRAALKLNGDPTDDVASIAADHCEVEYQLPTAAKPRKSQTFAIAIAAHVNQGNEDATEEGSPSNSARLAVLEAQLGAQHVLTGIVDYTGGGATKLDGVATVDVPVGHFFKFYHPTENGVREYVLVSSTNPTSSAPGTVVPTDFDLLTNQKNFIRCI